MTHPDQDQCQPSTPMSSPPDLTSRRNLLIKASLLSLAIPGMGLGLSGCDRRGSGKTETTAGADTNAGHAAMMHDPAASGDFSTMQVAAALSSATPTIPLQTYDANLPSLPTSDTLRLHWTSQEVFLQISPEMKVLAYTFDKNVPGPIAHCRVGDTVEFTLTNQVMMAHSMDFHAAQIDPKTAFRNIAENQSVSYSFKPKYAGAYLYHCGTDPMLLHIGAGMYGAIIVSPREPLPPAREFVLVQGEYYLGAQIKGVYSLDFGKMLAATPDLVAFNGRPGQYMQHPLRAKVGERVRFWVVNAGPNLPCAFHLVGEQFDTVYLGAPPESAIHGVQTFSVPPGGGMGFELICDVPGEFHFVNHAAAYAQVGAMGSLIVE